MEHRLVLEGLAILTPRWIEVAGLVVKIYAARDLRLMLERAPVTHLREHVVTLDVRVDRAHCILALVRDGRTACHAHAEQLIQARELHRTGGLVLVEVGQMPLTWITPRWRAGLIDLTHHLGDDLHLGLS